MSGETKGNYNRLGRKGKLPTSSYFKQWYDPEKFPEIEPKYCLDELREAFLETKDFTEYQPAMQIVGSWKEWTRLKNGSHELREFIDDCKTELEIALRSEACRKIFELVSEGSGSVQLSAAKWLAEKKYDKQEKGRPSNNAIDQAAEKMAKAANVTEDEFKRVSEFMDKGDSLLN